MIHYPGPQLVPDALLAGRGAGEGRPLWAVGDLGLLEAPSLVAVVGTRDPSPDALRRAGRLARELARAGSVVVSGLARGIDTAAHRAAIEAGGRTIAVLGTPLDQAWPPENAELQRLIMARHLALTQLPAGSTVHRSSFFRRNRTMALISDATVIVEAGRGKGTPSMGRDTLSLGRPLFILQSAAANPTLRPLLERGARSLSATADLLAALGLPQLDGLALAPAPLARRWP